MSGGAAGLGRRRAAGGGRRAGRGGGGRGRGHARRGGRGAGRGLRDALTIDALVPGRAADEGGAGRAGAEVARLPALLVDHPVAAQLLTLVAGGRGRGGG